MLCYMDNCSFFFFFFFPRMEAPYFIFKCISVGVNKVLLLLLLLLLLHSDIVYNFVVSEIEYGKL